jgi:hypothetical protein
MKKTIVKICFFIGIVSFIVYTLNNAVPNISDNERLTIREILESKDSLFSITFGRSHAASLDYKYWDKRGYNLALGGRDLASILYQIQFLVPRLNQLEEVIIFITFSTFYYDNEAISHGNLNDARKSLYYSIPSYKIINSNDLSNFFFGKLVPFVQADHGYSLLKKNINTEDLGVWRNWSDSYMDSIDMFRSGKKQAEMHSRDRYLSEMYNPSIVNDNVQNLSRILSFLEENDIECIVLTSPYYNSYINEFPQKDISEMYLVISKLQERHAFKYYDFSIDIEFATNFRLFHNADHLNSEGKMLFTKKLLTKRSNDGFKARYHRLRKNGPNSASGH